jgi:hypothetical protein
MTKYFGPVLRNGLTIALIFYPFFGEDKHRKKEKNTNLHSHKILFERLSKEKGAHYNHFQTSPHLFHHDARALKNLHRGFAAPSRHWSERRCFRGFTRESSNQKIETRSQKQRNDDERNDDERNDEQRHL